MTGKHFLLGASVGLIVTLGRLCGAPSSSADEIVAKWLATQEAKSELLFVAMQQRDTPAAEPKEHRFLAVYRMNDNGGVNYFLRMIRPEDVEGVTLLVLDDGQGGIKRFLYLPAVGRSRELTGEASQQPFINSDFSYADLEREVPEVHAYERLDDATVNQLECYHIRAVEKERPEGSPYAYRDIFIDQKTNRLQQVDFVNPAGDVVKTLTALEYDSPDVKGATKRPRRLVMKNNATGSVTEFTVIEGRLDADFSPDIFTTKRMETWKPWELDDFIFQFGMTIRSD